MRDLHHITLDTGDAAMIPASHVQSATLDALRPVLAALARAGEARLPPPLEGWRVTAGQEAGRCLSAMLQTRIGDDWLGVVWLGIARHSRCGSSLWRSMHGGGKVLTDANRQPATPWLATRMLPGALLVASDLAWIADFSECLAWAWMGEEAR